MSLEVNAYARSNDPVLRSDMDEALTAAGLRYLLFEDLDSFRLAGGAFVRNCDMVAWDNESGMEDDVKRAVATRDQAALGKLLSDDRIGSLAIHLELPYMPDPEVITDLRVQGVNRTIVDRIAEATLFYSVSTPETRNDFSMDLQTMVGNLLGAALDGIIEDPQVGTFYNMARDDGRPLPTQARKKPWWRFW